jgi:hypothetical protein
MLRLNRVFEGTAIYKNKKTAENINGREKDSRHWKHFMFAPPVVR